MNRNLTFLIRFFMDECLPPLIRDNKYFMYPFFYLAYRGKDINRIMNLKRLLPQFTKKEYDELYGAIDSISRNRTTDLNSQSVKLILAQLNSSHQTFLDVGCGLGYLLHRVKNKIPKAQLYGVDVKTPPNVTGFEFKEGDVTQLPFEDKSIDVVTSCHTLEHIVDLPKAISELKRVTKKILIIVVPCQRPFYYTLDEHINFFQWEEQLTAPINIENFSCHKVWGDWVYVGKL